MKRIIKPIMRLTEILEAVNNGVTEENLDCYCFIEPQKEKEQLKRLRESIKIGQKELF